MLVWVVVVWRWQDPFTAALHALEAASARLAATTTASPPTSPRATPRTTSRRRLPRRCSARRRAATEFNSRRGQAIGRIRVPRLGLNMIVVNGTDATRRCEKGPGRDLRTYMPGEGQLIYIAGHRTTYLAPFAHIDTMRPGDLVTSRCPYGTFRYRVFRHGSSPPTTSPCSARTAARWSRCRPATRASSRPTATSSTRRLAQVAPSRRASGLHAAVDECSPRRRSPRRRDDGPAFSRA